MILKNICAGFYKNLRSKYFPNTLTLEMFKLFASHLGIGKIETLNVL